MCQRQVIIANAKILALEVREQDHMSLVMESLSCKK